MTYKNLDNYLKSKSGAEKHLQKSWKWLRYLVNDKLFAMVCVTDDHRPVLTLRASLSQVKELPLKFPEIIVEDMFIEPMHWITVFLDMIHEFSDEFLFNLIDKSYNISLQTLPTLAQNIHNSSHEDITYDIPVDKMNSNMESFLDQVNIRVTRNLAEEEKNLQLQKEIIKKLPNLPNLKNLK